MDSDSSIPGTSGRKRDTETPQATGRALIAVTPRPSRRWFAALTPSHGAIAAAVAGVMGLGFVGGTALFAGRPQAVAAVAEPTPVPLTQMDVLRSLQGEVQSLRASLDGKYSASELQNLNAARSFTIKLVRQRQLWMNFPVERVLVRQESAEEHRAERRVLRLISVSCTSFEPIIVCPPSK